MSKLGAKAGIGKYINLLTTLGLVSIQNEKLLWDSVKEVEECFKGMGLANSIQRLLGLV